VIEKFLKGTTGSARSALLIGLWITTWGAGITAVTLGWSVGLAWLVVTGTTCMVARAKLSDPSMPDQAIDADETHDETSLEERVMARLATEASETADA
jgi:hypothetical protein